MSPDLLYYDGYIPELKCPEPVWVPLLQQELNTPFLDEQKRSVNRLLFALASDTHAAQTDAPIGTLLHSSDMAAYANLIYLLERGPISPNNVLNPTAAEILNSAFLLHDQGKRKLPSLHQYKKPYSRSEYEENKAHTTLGAELAERNGLPKPILDVIRYHHELFDSSGYEGLKGNETPTIASFAAIVDATQVAHHPRPYDPNGSGSTKQKLKDIHSKFSYVESKFDPRFLGAYEALTKILSNEGVVQYIHQRSICEVRKFMNRPFNASDYNFINAPSEIAREVVFLCST